MTPDKWTAERIRVMPSGCWEWKLSRMKSGYGACHTMAPSGKRLFTSAHRHVYQRLVGPVAPEMTIDHLCRNRPCVNPEHMEVVTRAENLRRGFGASAINARKTHCIRGHEFTPENTKPREGDKRHCRTCANDNARRRYASTEQRKEGER